MKKLLGAVREQLDQQIQNLDEQTLSQLRTARRAAIEATHHSRLRQAGPWLGVALATGLIAMLVIPVWQSGHEPGFDLIQQELSPDDMDLVSRLEDYEQDYEFYYWIDDEADAG